MGHNCVPDTGESAAPALWAPRVLQAPQSDSGGSASRPGCSPFRRTRCSAGELRGSHTARVGAPLGGLGGAGQLGGSPTLTDARAGRTARSHPAGRPTEPAAHWARWCLLRRLGKGPSPGCSGPGGRLRSAAQILSRLPAGRRRRQLPGRRRREQGMLGERPRAGRCGSARRGSARRPLVLRSRHDSTITIGSQT